MENNLEAHHAYHSIHGMKEVKTMNEFNFLLANGWVDSPAKFDELKKEKVKKEKKEDAVSE